MTSHQEDPVWVADLLVGDPSKAKELMRSIDRLGEVFGVEAADDSRDAMKKMVGRGLLRKVQREAPGWDGKDRIVPRPDGL